MTQLDDILNCYDWFDHIDGPKFVETHRDQFRTSGHWLFLPKVISYFHKVDNNAELWYIHIGRLVIHLLTPEGLHQELYLGTDIHSGERPVVVIPSNCWQAAEIPEGVPFAFGTNVCAPPFSYESLTIADQESLIREYPLHSDLIHLGFNSPPLAANKYNANSFRYPARLRRGASLKRFTRNKISK